MSIHHAPSKSKKNINHHGNGHDHEATSPIVRSDTTSGPAILNAKLARTMASPAAREQMIAELAYQYASARGFTPGHELADWFAAEHEVSARLADLGGHLAL